jgi:hypothetical protein
MRFSLPCNNKGCGKINEPYLDPNDDKVYCSECDKEMTGITSFVKMQMKSNKQIKQFRAKKPKPFSVKCPRCGKDDRPKLVQEDIICSGCNKPLDQLSEPFKIMLREKLRTTDRDV